MPYSRRDLPLPMMMRISRREPKIADKVKFLLITDYITRLTDETFIPGSLAARTIAV